MINLVDKRWDPKLNQPGIVEQYWTGVASQLQVEAEVFNRLVGHNGEMGRANELALAQLATRLLPSTVEVGTGIIIDSSGARSKQIDVIVYERVSQPQVMAQSTQLLFPVETVVAALEVKTTVDAAAVADAGAKFASVKQLTPKGGRQVPLTGFFGYSASGSPSSRAQEVNDLGEMEEPDISCVLNPGLAGTAASGGLGLVPLHVVGADGKRMDLSWVEAAGSGSWEVRGSHSYPVSRLVNNGTRYVFEPGRALLIFAQALSAGIASRTHAESGWLDSYLPEIARQIVLPVKA